MDTNEDTIETPALLSFFNNCIGTGIWEAWELDILGAPPGRH
jgi:hypothetical protein